jgi:hypothetical protein
MNYKTFAKKYLDKVGAFDTDSNYGGMIGESVMELVETFSEQGHSGMSAHITGEAFAALNRAYENSDHDIWKEYWASPEGIALQESVGTPGIMNKDL